MESSVFLTLQVAEGTLRRILVQVLLVLAQTDEQLGDRHLVRGLAHEFFVDLLGVCLITGTDGRVPAVGQVEFDGALVTHTLGGSSGLLHVSPRVLCRG